MKTIHGDIVKLAVQGYFDVIVHGCNCMHTMGAGLARQVKQQLPEAYTADLKTKRADASKLGTYSSAQCRRGNTAFTILNAYTQYHFKGPKPRTNYKAVRDVFHQINRDFASKHIGYPLIGAGLAGGDWRIIREIIDQESTDVEHTLVKYKRNR